MIEQLVSAPRFLLIQNDEILDISSSPVDLCYSYADRQADIIVAVGVRNELGQNEVVGICGHYRYRPFCKTWIIVVDDNIPTEVDITGNPGQLLRDCLYELKKMGRLNDPCNFSRVTIEATL
jgi:thiamine pyrophosphate-dependent acetolactate synthase large subunit-like protein